MEISFVFSMLTLVVLLSCCLTSANNINPRELREIIYWPNGTIPYVFSDDYTERERDLIRVAMDRWEEKTCIKFLPWTDELTRVVGGKKYLKLFRKGNCFSGANGLGRNQPQLLGIGINCLTIRTIVHELGHAIGLIHEMNREDRDRYIKLLLKNVKNASRGTYKKLSELNIRYKSHQVPYNYRSIMHYGSKAYSKNRNDTIITLDPIYQDIIGKANDISFLDGLYAYRAYNCSVKCSGHEECRRGGYRAGPRCACVCPDGFIGEKCEINLPGIQHVVDWRCQNSWTFGKGKCFKFVYNDKVNFNTARKRCKKKKAELVTHTNTEEWEWVIKRIEESIKIRDVKSFWLGLSRNAGEAFASWVDGSTYSYEDTPNQRFLSISSRRLDQCGFTDGNRIVMATCGRRSGNGYICVKKFDDKCGGRYRIKKKKTAIVSPSYPNKYPSDMKCEYILKTHKGKTIKLVFQKFKLGIGDTLEVRSSDLHEEDPSNIYSADDLTDREILSTRNILKLTFTSNGEDETSGFRASATAIGVKDLTREWWLSRLMSKKMNRSIPSYMEYMWSHVKSSRFFIMV